MERVFSNKNEYRPEIDGLRALAIIAVIINHFNKDFLPSGYLGVDIFFVISGYVISSSLSRRKSNNFKEFLIDFYERRVKRIFPALVFFVLIASLFICFFNHYPGISLQTGLASLFGLSNIYLLQRSTDYFAQSTELNVFTHTWSLGVEEQFYFLFPFLVWFTGFSNKKKWGNRNLFYLILSLVILSLSCFIFLYSNNQPAAYFLMPARFWEIASGCLIFLLVQKNGIIKGKFTNQLTILILITLTGIFLLPISTAIFSTILVVFLTSLLILFLNERNFSYKLLTNKIITHIGLISYSLYLWHWGVLSISRWTIGIHWWSIPFQILLIYILAFVSYNYLEMPLRRKNWSTKKWKTIIKGISGLLFSSFILIGLGKFLQGKLYLGEHIIKIDKSWRNNSLSANEKINGKKCHGDRNYSQAEIDYLFESCQISNPEKESNTTIAFVGDSHVLPLMNSQKIFYENKFNLIHYSYNGCPFPYPEYGIFPADCENFLKISTNKVLDDLKSGDFIIIFNYHLSHLGDYLLADTRHHFYDKDGNQPTSGDKKFEIYTSSLIKFSNLAKKKGIKVILIGSTIRDNMFLRSSKEWFRPFPKKVLEEEYANANKINIAFKERFEKFQNIFFFDTLKEVPCCDNHQQYSIYLRDSDHLSDYGAKALTKKLIPFILKINNQT
tara:strand:+ start:410 stop:2419 length:2010 start_codon:yes stop_codon:yes gene_type:complete